MGGIERETRPAGYLAGFHRKAFVFDSALHWLNLNALETTEEGVVGEINFCRDLVR